MKLKQFDISKLPQQTQQEMHDLVCKHMGELAFITTRGGTNGQIGKRLFVRLDPEHKRMLFIGWIVKVEISPNQNELICECKKPGRLVLIKGRRTCSICLRPTINIER